MGDGSARDGHSGKRVSIPDSRRAFAAVALAFLPWTVTVTDGYVSLFFAFGIVDPGSLTVTPITDYYLRYTTGLPTYLASYGIGVGIYLLALGSVVVGRWWRSDERVTAALLVFAGLSELWVTVGFLGRPGYVAVPIGTLLFWFVAWWGYRPGRCRDAFRRT